jgi:hypothetical protein
MTSTRFSRGVVLLLGVLLLGTPLPPFTEAIVGTQPESI